MKEKLMNVWCVLKITFEEFNRDKASQMAAAQAYFTIFALPPLLILLAMVLGMFLDDTTIQKHVLTPRRTSSAAMPPSKRFRISSPMPRPRSTTALGPVSSVSGC